MAYPQLCRRRSSNSDFGRQCRFWNVWWSTLNSLPRLLPYPGRPFSIPGVFRSEAPPQPERERTYGEQPSLDLAAWQQECRHIFWGRWTMD